MAIYGLIRFWKLARKLPGMDERLLAIPLMWLSSSVQPKKLLVPFLLFCSAHFIVFGAQARTQGEGSPECPGPIRGADKGGR